MVGGQKWQKLRPKTSVTFKNTHSNDEIPLTSSISTIAPNWGTIWGPSLRLGGVLHTQTVSQYLDAAGSLPDLDAESLCLTSSCCLAIDTYFNKRGKLGWTFELPASLTLSHLRGWQSLPCSCLVILESWFSPTVHYKFINQFFLAPRTDPKGTHFSTGPPSPSHNTFASPLNLEEPSEGLLPPFSHFLYYILFYLWRVL